MRTGYTAKFIVLEVGHITRWQTGEGNGITRKRPASCQPKPEITLSDLCRAEKANLTSANSLISNIMSK